MSLAAAAIPREGPLRSPRPLQQQQQQADATDHHRLGSGNPDTRDFAGDVVRSLQTETWHHVLASLGCVTRVFFALSHVQCFGVVL